MHKTLENILQNKRNEVDLLRGKGREQFMNIFTNNSLAVIAEFKRRSPSKGRFTEILDPTALLKEYLEGGASAFSILTDTHFDGSLKDLTIATKLGVPVLRKEFIINPIQLSESHFYGADAVLAIASIISDSMLAEILAVAKKLNLATIVEVHNQREIEIALHHGAEIIGINNRNLHTFTLDPDLCASLITKIPDHIVKIAESGISNPTTARRYYHMGFQGVLIGESLMRSCDRAQFIRECIND